MTKQIKAIYTKHYGLRLMESPVGEYYILYAKKLTSMNNWLSSENISDLKMACYLFDIKNEEFEGQ